MKNLAKLPEFHSACRQLDVILVYFHGSRARGKERPDSDYDFAVLLNDLRSWEPWEKIERLDKLGEAIAQILNVGRDQIDIQDLGDMPVTIAMNVITHGRCVWEGEKSLDVHFRRQTLNRYQDFEPIERFFRKAVRRRFLERASG